MEHTGPIDSNEGKIVIDYTVTLDLNGCSLSLGNYNEEEDYDDFSVSEFFDVTTNGTFTITDLSGCEEAGCISADGNSATSIIENKGTVIIENGMIDQWGSDDVDDPIIIDNSGSLTVERGSLFSCGSVIDSEAGSKTYIGVENDTNIDQDDHFDYKLSIDSYGNSIFIHSDDDTVETIFEMKGGFVYGDVVAVNLDGKNVNGEVSGGNIKASASGSTALLVQNYSTCIIYGGDITNSKNGVSDASYAVHLANNAECIIKGGIIDGKFYSYSVYSEDSKCSIYGGTIKGDPNNGGTPKTDNAGRPTIYCSTKKTSPETEYSFDMRGGSVEGNGLKLFLDKNVKGRITGGNIQTTANRAIQLSGAVLDIDGTYNTINISNGNTQAVGSGFSTILIGDGSNCTISGEKATISNNANGYAVEIKDSECMISGGTIKTASFIHPAVYCYRKKEGTTTDLTIQWAEGSSESDSLREGPLIVCTYDPGQSGLTYLGAVSTKKLVVYANENDEVGTTLPNYAKVDISGGYLYAKNGAFYSQSQEGSLSITGSFYTNLGSLESPIKSPYFDFTQECLKYVFSELVGVVYGGYSFGFKISATWTYVIENCSQTKTEIGADEAVTYSFRSYKQKGTEKVAVPWIAQMCVAGNGNEWRDNHSYGPDENGWYWTTSRDDGVGGADRGIGSVDSNEDYTITFKSTKSDTYSVKIIASDAAGSTSYTFAPVVQTISSSPSTDPTITELWHGSTTEVSISSTNFNNASPRSGCMLRVYAEVNQQNNPINTITCTLVAGANGDIQQQEKFTDDGFVEFEIAETLYDVICSYGCKFVIYYGANITKVELIQ